jgi:hypothetical protein
MSRIFDISIILNKESQIEELLYDGDSICEDGISDKLRISNHSINLICKRSKDRELARLIADFKSTINIQVTKGISFFAAVKGSIPLIEKIVIKKFDNLGVFLDKYETTKVIQPFNNKLPSNLILEADDLKVLFTEGKKAKTLLVALSFWLKGVTASQPGESFDKLWTSFNSLYSYITGEKSETEKLRRMRDFIISNVSLFPLSCELFDSFNKDKIRELQWRNLILNDHENYNDTKSFYGFIMRYSDYRINQVFKDILCYRKDYLLNQNLLTDTVNHINSCIVMNEKKNVEVLTFYLIKYSYFIRNKYFHGEKVNPTFHLIQNDEVEELALLNIVLSTFLKELISENACY